MSKFSMKRLRKSDQDFDADLDALISWESVVDTEKEALVAEIISKVRTSGDQALMDYAKRFDNHCASLDDMKMNSTHLEQAFLRLSYEQQQALTVAAERVRAYHQRQKMEAFLYTDKEGVCLGQQVTAMERVGVYVPGGLAPLASSVIMSVVPAVVAGVSDIVMTTPAPSGKVSDLVLGAAFVAGVNRVFLFGGAQAIAAMAYGTQTIPAVDKIVGAGNSYVTTAKKQVFGKVGIDMIAGPSEILIVCDGKTPAKWVAMDLFSQAEHSEDAQSILISDDWEYLDQVEEQIRLLMPQMERAQTIKESLLRRGAFIYVDDLNDAKALINRIAPEHLELSIDHAESWLPDIRNAGAIFLGRYTTESLGDYCAGPSHVLPTSGTARFFSPLSVYDFQKRTSIIRVDPAGAELLGMTASQLARGEQLTAHALSAEYRMKNS